MPDLPFGIYDHLVSEKLRLALDSLDASEKVHVFGKLEEQLASDYLTRFLRAQISKALRIVSPDRQLELTNQLIRALSNFDESLSFLFLGALALALGIGFLLSAAAAYRLSKSWGLVNGQPEIQS